MIFNPKTFTLNNGMECIVIENHMTPAVFHSVWVKVGGADEPTGKSGMAHFLEHLMFRGTEKIGPGEYDKIVSGLGGVNNAFTSQDVTCYHVKCAKEHLARVMEIEADRLEGLKITPKLFDTEKKVILEERKSRVDNDPFGQLREQMQALLFQHHPYKIPIIGWEHEIKGLTRDDVMSFYRAHYAPNNAILVVSGDITVDEVKPLAVKYFGALPKADLKPRFRPSEPPAIVEKRLTLKHSQIQQEQFVRIYRTPAGREMSPVEVAGMEVMADLLAGSQTSTLYKTLVVEGKQALNINTSFMGHYIDAGFFNISAMPAPGHTVEKLERIIDEQLSAAITKGFSADDVARTKKKMKADAIYARDSLDRGAELIGHTVAAMGKISDIEEWDDALNQVTPELLSKLAKQTMNLKMSVTGHLKPETQHLAKAA